MKRLAGCANMIRMTSDHYVIYRNIVGNKRKGATFATYTRARRLQISLHNSEAVIVHSDYLEASSQFCPYQYHS